MALQGRIGDIGLGICPCHDSPISYSTVIVTGAITVKTNERDTAFIRSIGMSSCGHATIALTGSTTVFSEASPHHRVGDMGANCGPYILVTGSSNVITGG